MQPNVSSKQLAQLLQVPTVECIHIPEGYSKQQHWQLRYLDRSWFLTVFDPHMPQHTKDARLAKQRLALTLDLMPSTLICADDASFYITDYLPPTQTPWWEDSDAVVDLAKRIRIMHQTPIDPTWDPAQTVDLRLQQKWEGLKDLPFWHDAQRTFLQNLPTGLQSAWTHQDLHPLNVRFHNGRSWVCDWEYAGLGDPLGDVMMMHQYLSPKNADLWLEHVQSTPANPNAMRQHNAKHWALCCLWAYTQADDLHHTSAQQVSNALQAPQDLRDFHTPFLTHSFANTGEAFLALFAAAFHAWCQAL